MIPQLLLLPSLALASTPEQFELIGDVTRFASYGAGMVMVFLAPLVHFKSGSLGALWALVSFVMYVRWFAGMNIQASKFFDAFAGSVGESSNPRNIIPIPSNASISQVRMSSLGITSPLFLLNSQQLLLGLSVPIAILVLCVLLDRGNSESLIYALRRKVQYSLVILGWLLAYGDLMVYALLQLQNPSASSAVSIVSTALAGCYLLCAIVFALFIPSALYRKRKSVAAGDTKDCAYWTILIEGMRPGMQAAKYQQYTVYVLQRVLAAGIYVFLYEFENVQVLCMLVVETAVLVWCTLTRPYSRISENLTALLLQTCVCLLLLFLGCFVRSWSEEEESFISLAYISAYLFGITLCLVRFACGLSSTPAPALLPGTDETKADQCSQNESRLDMTHDSDKIRSQLPNEPYFTTVYPSLSGTPQKATRVVPLCAVKDVKEIDSFGTVWAKAHQ